MIACIALAAITPAFAAPVFDPLNVIPYDTFRGSTSMTQADIQSFLDTLSGPLKSLNTTDYVNPGGTNGVGTPWKKGQPKKTAARIIWEAASHWSINPKVILATLQKEQSLLTVSNSSNATRLRKAVGCGVYPGSTNTYPGFGNQVWNGTRKLSTYEITYAWKPGKTIKVSGAKTPTIVPKNASTFALYTYTPYYPQSLVWTVYVRYFGDPQLPPRLRPVYRYLNVHNGTYFYSTSEGTRYRLKSSSVWHYNGVAFTVDTSSTANSGPLYCVKNSVTGALVYTASPASRSAYLAKTPKVWRSNGVACLVSPVKAAGAQAVYRLTNKRTHASLLTSSPTAKKSLTTGKSPAFVYTGVAFYLGVSATTTPVVGPR